MITSAAPGLVWHYTSLSTLESALNHKELWAGEASFQNDPSEITLAQEVIDAAVRSTEGTPEHVHARRSADDLKHLFEPDSLALNAELLLAGARFILCASEDGDNLYAWRTYAAKGSIGCAIGLDADAALSVASSATPAPSATAWQRVVYERDALIGDVRDTLVGLQRERLASPDPGDLGETFEGLRELWTRVLSTAKHPSYLHEAETRITVTGITDSRDVSFMPGVAGPRPFVRLISQAPTGRDRLPIRAVRLAPDAPERSIRSLQWILAVNGYPIDGELEYQGAHLPPVVSTANRVQVLRSVHPYRIP